MKKDKIMQRDFENNKKHTFVICAYKESIYLEECIRSVVSQRNYSDVVLVTSTPNDYIGKLCEKYQIPMYVNSGEKGITQDWEFGLNCVKTEFATIAHQDDVYFENYSKRIIKECMSACNPIICFTDYWELRNGQYIKNNRLLRIKRLMLMPLYVPLARKSIFIRRLILSFGNAICCPSVTYALNNIQRPFFYNHFRSNEDWEAWERYSKQKGEFIYISEPLMAHRIHSGSETSMIIGDDGRSLEDYEMYRKFWPECIASFLVKKYKKSEKSNMVM